MKALKITALIWLAALFYIGCSGDQTNGTANNTNRRPQDLPLLNSNANTSSPANTNQPAAAPASINDSNAEAAALYKNQCITCHGPDGKGNPAMKNVPDFSNAEWQRARKDEELANTIKKGSMPGMPAFES